MCVAAANYVINRVNEYNEKYPNARISMTCKRLQKLLYFSDVFFMKQNNGESMFRDEFYAWPSGPVIPSVYYGFMKYQSGVMSPIEEENDGILTEQMIRAIESVLEETWEMDTLDLVDFSHVDGGPWRKHYCEVDPNHEQIIPKSDIFAFYKNCNVFVK